MKFYLFTFILIVASVANEKVTVSIGELKGVGLSTNQVEKIRQSLKTQLVNSTKLSMVERDGVDVILFEQALHQGRCRQ